MLLGNIEGPRGCEIWELGELLDFLVSIFKLESSKNLKVGSEYAHIISFAINNSKNLRIVKHNGEIVGHVGIYPILVKVGELGLKVGTIFGVATKLEYRNKGIAKSLLMDAIEKMKKEKYDLSILWTSIPEFYRKLGWENAGTRITFYLNSSNIDLLPTYNGLEIKRLEDDSQLSDIIKLHNSKNGVIWDEQKAKFLVLRKTVDSFLAYENREMLGYIIVVDSRVVDFGGETKSIFSLIKYVFSTKSLTNLELQTSLNLKETRILEELGIPYKKSYLGMIKIINLQNLEKLLLNCNIKINEIEDSSYLIKYNEEEKKD